MQLEVCKEQVEWAKSEKRTFLRQRIEARLANLYLGSKDFSAALALISRLLSEVCASPLALSMCAVMLHLPAAGQPFYLYPCLALGQIVRGCLVQVRRRSSLSFPNVGGIASDSTAAGLSCTFKLSVERQRLHSGHAGPFVQIK